MAEQKYRSVVIRGGPKDFNDFISNNVGKYDLYVFSNENVKEVVPNLEVIYGNYLHKYNNEFVGAVYSDGFVRRAHSQGNYILPSSSADLFKKSMFYVPIIAVSGKIQTRIFNEKLKHIYFYDALKKISATSLVLHCPELCYSFEEMTFDLNEDLANL